MFLGMSVWQRLDAITASDHWAAAGWTMLHFLWLGTLLALLLAALRPFLRHLQADLRYLIHLAFFALLTLLPAGIFFYTLDRTPPFAQVIVTADTPAAAHTLSDYAINVQPRAAVPVATPAPSLYDSLQSKLSLAASKLPWLYFTGAPLALILLAAGVAGGNRLRRQSMPLEDSSILDLFDRLTHDLAIARPVTLALCDRVVSPLLIGIVRPVILLPPSALAQLTLEQLEMILLHELAHVRRWDNLVNLLQRLAEGLLFFHPAVWIVSRQVRLERERCCDAAVLARTGSPVQYIETLASFAMPGVAPRYAAAAMANHQLVARIRTILNLEDRTMFLSRRTFTCAAAAVVTGLSLVVAYGQQPPATTGATDAIELTAEPVPNTDYILLQGDVHVLADQTKDDLLLERLSELRRAYLDANKAVPAELQRLEDQTKANHARYGRLSNARSYLGVATQLASKRRWGPEQATGAPDVAEAGDNPSAWASLTEDGQAEGLELTYKQPVEAAAILIHESFNPGAVSGVSVVGPDKKQIRVFNGQSSTLGREKGVMVVSLPKPISISKVLLSIDSQRVPGWNEIDAVGLLDARTGEIHWATSATASSTYAEQPAAQNPAAQSAMGGLRGYNTRKNADASVERLQAENQELRKMIQEQRSAMERQEKMLRDLQRAIESLNDGQVNPLNQPHIPGSGTRERSNRSGLRSRPGGFNPVGPARTPELSETHIDILTPQAEIEFTPVRPAAPTMPTGPATPAEPTRSTDPVEPATPAQPRELQ